MGAKKAYREIKEYYKKISDNPKSVEIIKTYGAGTPKIRFSMIDDDGQIVWLIISFPPCRKDGRRRSSRHNFRITLRQKFRANNLTSKIDRI